MTRPKAIGNKKRAGRKSTFSPRKEVILANFAETYRDAHRNSKPEVALFLTKLANWCINRWGYIQSMSVDVEGEDDDPEEVHDLEADIEPADDDLTEAEAAFRVGVFTDLRTKLGQFYRRKFLHGPLGVKDNEPSTCESVLSFVAAKVPKKPMKSNYLNQYMKMYYQKIMKSEADRRLAAESAEYNKLSAEDKESQGPPVPVRIRTNVAREFWATETEEIKAAVKAAADKEHDEDLVEWGALKDLPQTPAQHYHQIQFAGVTLRPVADAIAHQMACPVIILLPVIVPYKDGTRIEMVSVHGTKPGSLASDKFPVKDPVGYAETEALVKKYGVSQYTAVERAARMFPPGEGPSHDNDKDKDDLETPGPSLDGTSWLTSLLQAPSHPAASTLQPSPPPAPQQPDPAASEQLSSPRAPSRSTASTLLPSPPPAPQQPDPAPEQLLSPRAPLHPTASTLQPSPPPAPHPSLSPVSPTQASSLFQKDPTLPLAWPICDTIIDPPLLSPIARTTHPTYEFESSIPAWPIGGAIIDPPSPSPIARTTPAIPPPTPAVPPPTPAVPPPTPAVPPPTPTVSLPAPTIPPQAPIPPPSPLLDDPTVPISPPPPSITSGSVANFRSAVAPSPIGASATPKRPSLVVLHQRRSSIPVSTPKSASAVQGPLTPSPTRTPHLGFLDLPDHMQAMHDYFLYEPSGKTLRPFGMQWVICIREFVMFEMRSGFVQDGSEKLAKAPDEVSYWRRLHRPFKDQGPRRRTTDAFIAEWFTWWSSLQPAERIRGPNGKYNAPKAEMDWSALAKPGANGFLLIMLALTWWGMLKFDDEWVRAATDVTAVLRLLPKPSTPPPTPTPSSKRKVPLSNSAGHIVNTEKPNKRQKVDAIPKAPAVSPRRLRSH